MTIETINGCILIPDRCNWAVKPKWSRRWPDNIVGAATAAEDRSALRSQPMERIEFAALAPTVWERNQLIARVMQAIKTGNAALPNWGRPAYTLTGTDALDVTVKTQPPLAVGDWVLIVNPKGLIGSRVLRINCGGSLSGEWIADRFYDTGVTLGTTNTIVTTGLVEPAPQAVYKAARSVVGENAPASIKYTLSGFLPGVAATVRLHFAELDPDMGGTYQRKMDVVVAGADKTTWSSYEIYAAAGALDKADILTAMVTPGSDGRITVTVTGVYPHVVGIPSPFYYPASINGIEVFQSSFVARQLTQVDAGHLYWGERLRAYFPAGSMIVPLICGRFGLNGNVAQLTDHMAAVPAMYAEEPATTGSVAVPGLCPVPDTLDLPYDDDPGTSVLPGLRQDTKYRWNLPASPGPNVSLTVEQILWHKEIANTEITDPILGYFWEYAPPPQGSQQWDALVKYESGNSDPSDSTPGDDLNAMGSGFWKLVVVL